MDWGLFYQFCCLLEVCSGDVLMVCVEDVLKCIVFDGVCFIVVIVDVQGGKKWCFVVQVVGYGVYGECWIIDCYNICYFLRVNEDGESQFVNLVVRLEDWDLLKMDVLEKMYLLVVDFEQFMLVLVMVVDLGGEDGVIDNVYVFW